MNKFLTVIIPCYNELENLNRGVLDEVYAYLKKQKFAWEVIISDDASTDGSIEFIEKYIKTKKDFIQIRNHKGGKAFAIKSAIKNAQGRFVLFTDMDQSTPISEFEKFKPHLETHPIVIGSRGFKRENFPLLRKIASPMFLLFRRLLILREIRDTQCGFKCFDLKAVKEIFSRLYVFKRPPGKGWRVGAWDVELLFVARKLGYKIKEVTVSWSDTDTSTKKERKFVQESVEMLKEVMRVRVNQVLGRYDT